MALGALGVLHRAGLRVPETLALAGFDDIPEAAFFFPPLTTVYQPVIEVGRVAVQELFARIEGERLRQDGKPATAARLLPTLVVRASTTAS
jgi:DNA-binding LacI/PurR family transcriptional regulator